MSEIFLDLNQVSSEEDFHELVLKKFLFPHYYGKNKDAFWDCLTEIFDEVSVYIKGYNEAALNNKSWLNDYLKMLLEYEQQTKGRFKVFFN